MVYVVESAEYAPGKRQEALAFLKEIAKYHEKEPGTELRIFRRVAPGSGMEARLTTVYTVYSVSVWSQIRQKRHEDPQWRELVKDAFHPDKGSLVHNTYTQTLLDEA